MKTLIEKIKVTYNRLPKWFKGIRGIIVLIVLVVLVLFFTKPSTPVQYEYQTVSSNTFKSTVEGSGRVSTEHEVNLVSLSSGNITSISVKPGALVKKGDIIARINSSDENISLEKAKNEIDSAQNSVEDNKNNLELVTSEQNQLVDNAHRTLLNSSLQARYSGSSDSNTYDSPTVSGTYTCDKEGSYKIKTYNSSGGVSAPYSGLENGTLLLNNQEHPIGTCGLFLSVGVDKKIEGGVDYTIEIPNKNASNYNSNYNSYLSVLKSKENNIANAEQNIKTSELSLTQANTSYKSSTIELDNTLVRAPFDGQIGTLSVSLGEYINSGSNIATLVTISKVAEVSLNEVDIASVVVGQKVDLTFDSVSDLTIPGTVSEIDTLGSEDQNVVTYKVKITFDKDDTRIKPGMNVTGNIIIQEKENTLLVPSGSINTEGEKSYVYVLNTESKDVNNPNKKVFIETGLANDTETEVISGISIEDKVMVRTLETSTVKPSGGFMGN